MTTRNNAVDLLGVSSALVHLYVLIFDVNGNIVDEFSNRETSSSSSSGTADMCLEIVEGTGNYACRHFFYVRGSSSDPAGGSNFHRLYSSGIATSRVRNDTENACTITTES